MPASQLASALEAVKWRKNIANFLSHEKAANSVANANLRLAIWAKQFESVDEGNPALCFVREMQFAGQQVAVLSALALYKASASAMRAMLETALYYSYFRTHPAELITLARQAGYYVSKAEIIEFHKVHTLNFQARQQKLGMVAGLEKWYSEVSAIVHGQIPGVWTASGAVKDICFDEKALEAALTKFADGADIVHKFFLVTMADAMWGHFSHQAKEYLVAGLHGEAKTLLGLDCA